jgi:hypothetical protein
VHENATANKDNNNDQHARPVDYDDLLRDVLAAVRRAHAGTSHYHPLG